MKKNKSIDGLTIRDASERPVSHPSKKKSPAKKIKVVAKKPEVPPEEPKTTPETQEVFPITAPEPTETQKESAKPTKTREQKVEDFLKPVQAFDFDESTGELKATKVSKKDKKKSKKLEKSEKKKPSKARRIITAIILIIVLALIGLVSWAVFWGNDIIAKITGGQGNVFDLIKFIEPTYDPLKTDANGRTNILAFGTSGYDMSGDEGNGPHAGAQLTDSIMMISLNQDTGDIAMISLPRDLKTFTACTATGKINEVYWCNGGGYDISAEEEGEAAEALMYEVGNILGVDFQYYAHVNWGALVSIVDILDGVNVTLDEDINDDWWTGAVYEAGVTYTLNGEEALGLSRARHGTMGGDFSRGASQQKILIGIKDKILEKNLSITDFVDLASALGDNLRTNFSINEMKSLAHLSFDFDFDNMRQLSLYDPSNDIYLMTTGTLDNGISYVFPRAGVGNYDDIQEYVAIHLSNDPRVYEEPSIIILNATDTAGLASTERDKLTEAGYYVANIDNAPEGIEFKDDYTIYGNGNKPGTKDMLRKFYENAYFKSISEAPESITRDYDFIIVLGPSPKKTEETSNN
ncbi:LCP family protein [Candidatus Saccharibacteria bacterium]|nr:LCP family protein [Candidatus Saccharibacteria bacterium]